MIHVADPRLVRLIALKKKTTHRFPARYKKDSDEVTHPKITAGKLHRVYTRAPFGRDGDPNAQPLVEVLVSSVELEPLGDMNDTEAVREGFASLDVFIAYWNRVWFNRALKFENNQYHPVWVISFELKKILPAGEKLINRIESKMRSVVKTR